MLIVEKEKLKKFYGKHVGVERKNCGISVVDVITGTAYSSIAGRISRYE
ncbi:MAG TPA: hypothetical protein PKB13_00490 [Clostridia bacterium]|nr:hypothetical protein [Clostridia bacterium]